MRPGHVSCLGRMSHAEKNPGSFRGHGGLRVPPKALHRANFRWYPDLAPALRIKARVKFTSSE